MNDEIDLTDDTEQPEARPRIAGFWRRIAAFVLDVMVVGAIGLLLGMTLGDVFVQLGPWGRVVGFVIALLYFGLGNSSVFGGQTPGKKALSIRVVDANDETISVPRSFARYSIIGLPFFLNNSQLAESLLTTPLIYPVALIIFGGLGSIIYLYIFNTKTRQSLHDLAVGTFVVKERGGDLQPQPVWQGHYKVVAVLMLASLSLPYLAGKFVSEGTFAEIMDAYEALNAHPDVMQAGVSAGVRRSIGTGSEPQQTTYLSGTAVVREEMLRNETLAMELARILADNFEGSDQIDVISIALVYGYDIGIASSWSRMVYYASPSELPPAEEIDGPI